MALAEVLKVNQETEPMHHGPLVLNMRRANMQETVHERAPWAMNAAVACPERSKISIHFNEDSTENFDDSVIQFQGDGQE